MGQQQLLLIIVGVVVFSIALAVGISMFVSNAVSSNRDAVTNDLVNFASRARQYYRRPLEMSGGAGKFDGITMKNLANTTGTTWTNPDGTYQLGTIVPGPSGSVTINGKGVEKGNDGGSSVEVNLFVTISTDSMWVVN